MTNGSGPIKQKLISILLTFILNFILLSCTENPVYLLPQEKTGEGVKAADQFNVLIRPIYTTDFQSEDRKKYLFDFSSYFTAIEVHFHNGTSEEVQWSPDQTVLKDAENIEYRALNEEDAFHYYKSGDSDGNTLTLLEKPYERQKEDIENINRFLIQSASIPPGGDVTGLILFKKVPLNNCDNVLLTVGGIHVNQAEKSVKFPLKCPKE